jgi:hypothetical protein
VPVADEPMDRAGLGRATGSWHDAGVDVFSRDRAVVVDAVGQGDRGAGDVEATGVAAAVLHEPVAGVVAAFGGGDRVVVDVGAGDLAVVVEAEVGGERRAGDLAKRCEVGPACPVQQAGRGVGWLRCPPRLARHGGDAD